MEEHEGGGDTDSIAGTNLHTQHPCERFLISSDSSHHSSANATDAEVTSFVRSFVLPPPAMTVAVTTTVIVGASFALMDIFAFIRHVEPTKVRVSEKQIEEGQVPLLVSTKGRVVPIAGEDNHAGSIVRVDHDTIKNVDYDDPNKKSGDVDQEDRSEENDHVGQDESATIPVDEEVQVTAVDKPIHLCINKQRKTIRCSSRTHMKLYK
uniref:Uncharacterized protein n=1 Tax=Tanacetum cinerariifolium TaxID=118510 RepID=A0A6L2KID1_TANCI|nr:hypothetical protein [Tanacetum cinerariifolium]